MSEPIGDDTPNAAPRPVPKCPICGKPREVAYRPFCSKRCADVDLGRWLNESYVVPGSPDADEDGDDASGTAQRRKDEDEAL